MTLLDAVKDNRFDIISEKLRASQRSRDTEVKDLFEIFTRQQSVTFWEFTYRNIKICIERIVLRASEGSGELLSAEAEEDIANLKGVLYAVNTFCTVSKAKPASLLSILDTAQGILTLVSKSPLLQSLKSTIAKLCELWWLGNEEGAENLIAQLLTYSLMSSLAIDGHESDIKRLYSLRSGFLLLDFDDVSSAFLRDLVERCFVHPSFLKCKEGQKLLAFLLTANQGLMLELVGSVIRPQLGLGSKAVSAAYGKIFYHAWKDAQCTCADGGDKDDEEDSSDARRSCSSAHEEEAGKNSEKVAQAVEDAVQGLLREGVHAADTKYFRGVRFMMQGFHDVQRTKLDAMLLRVYDPILWRALRCANAQVRAQAAVFFLDVFPLQHAEGRAEDSDRILQKQFDLLAALLTDSDHGVRAHAALGVCHILKEYWESLPVNTTHTILKYLVDTLSCDASCANVRHAVFVGLGELFQQPLAHAVLKQLLPLLQNCLHDKAEKVRVAFIRILCQIKSIRGMHYYEIVPVEHLLERLAEDRHCPAVCRALTELLLNSFYPLGDGNMDTQQVDRCRQFLERHPAAAEVFYAHLHECLAIGHVARLGTLLFAFLSSAAARNHKAAASSEGHDGEAVNEDDEDAENAPVAGKRRRATKMKAVELSFNVRLGLVRVVLRLVESVEDRLVVEVPSRELLAKYLTVDAAKELLLFCTQGDANEAAFIVPDAFRLVAVAAKLQAMGSAPTGAVKRGKKAAAAAAAAARSGTDPAELTALLRDVFCPAYAALDDERAKEVLARAVVGMFCEGQQMVALIAPITDALEAAQNGARAARPKARKASTQKALLPLPAALALLAACDAPASASDKASTQLATVFELVRATIETGIADGAVALSEDSLHKMLSCWAGWALRCDAERAVSSQENGDPTESKMGAVLDWAKQTLAAALGDGRAADLAGSLLALVVAQASDMLYLDLATEVVVGALADCLAAADGCALSPIAAHPAMAAALVRLNTLVLTAIQPHDAGSDATSSATGTLKTVLCKCLGTKELAVGEQSTGLGKGASVSGKQECLAVAGAEQAPTTGAVEAQVWAEI